jgi:threonyl-tRNA synthetase
MTVDENYLHALRHSTSHLLASAIMKMYPGTKLGNGPAIENGFYYDIDTDHPFTPEDLPKIEKEMRKVIASDQPFVRSTKPIADAVNWAKQSSQTYKEELLNDLMRAGTTVAKDLDAETLGVASDSSKVEEVSFYTNGDFSDLCRGPHIESTGRVGAFKLMRVSGAYWRGKEGNPQMQRLYGVAFEDQQALDSHLRMLEEAKKRDHRKLGQELDLFVFSELVGSGLPLFTPRGTVLRRELENFSQELSGNAPGSASFPHVTVGHVSAPD